jgi:RnfABCDGE-type electron transport complex B subunit
MDMYLIVIVLAIIVMLVLALAMTFVLGWANRAFHVDVDPKIEKINAALPGANCGGCGYIGCAEYAEAVVHGEGDVPVDLCPVGGSSCATRIAEILGLELKESYPYRPAVHCGATTDQKLKKNPYQGEAECAAANLVSGVQGCIYGCLGFGDCVTACKFDAIHMVDGKPVVDYDKCVGCAACAKACPRNVISMVPFKDEQMFVVTCNNKDFGKDVKAVCEVGCLGCKACARLVGDLISIEDNLPTVNYEEYPPAHVDEKMQAVLEKCPMKRFVKIGTPDRQDVEKVQDEEMPNVVVGEFKTTVDKTEWHG